MSEMTEEELEKYKIQKKYANPTENLRLALEEVGLDPKSPDFSEKVMFEKFEEMSKKREIGFQQRDRYEHLIAICKDHKFWNTQAIVRVGE